MNFCCNHELISALLEPRVNDYCGMILRALCKIYISPATCFGTLVREEFMGRLFIIIYRITTHINFWRWKFTFHKSNSFLQSWLSELVYEYLEEGADKSKCRHSCWSAGWPRTLITWNCSNLLIFFVLIILLFYCGALLFPHKGVECNGNHHYHGSWIEVSWNWFF